MTGVVPIHAAPVESQYLGADTRPRTKGREPNDLLYVTFAQMIARQAAVFADRELLADGATRMTYAEFETGMNDAARALMVLGVVPGDRVAVWAPNIVEWIVAALAADAALMPMNSRFKGAEALDVVRRGRPRVLFTVRGRRNRRRAACRVRRCHDLERGQRPSQPLGHVVECRARGLAG